MHFFLSLFLSFLVITLNSLYTASRSLRIRPWCHGVYDGQPGAYDASSARRSWIPSGLSALSARRILWPALVMQRQQRIRRTGWGRSRDRSRCRRRQCRCSRSRSRCQRKRRCSICAGGRCWAASAAAARSSWERESQNHSLNLPHTTTEQGRAEQRSAEQIEWQYQ